MKKFLTARYRDTAGEKWNGRENRGGGKNKKWKYRGETYVLMAQIHSPVPGEEEEAEQGETKKSRDTENSITGLALTVTFIQHGVTPSLFHCSLLLLGQRDGLFYWCKFPPSGPDFQMRCGITLSCVQFPHGTTSVPPWLVILHSE